MKNTKFLYLFFAASILVSCGSHEQKQEDATATSQTMETFVITKDKLSTSLQLPGELIAYQQVDLYAKVSSFVKELKVDIGSEVSAGELLITLEAPELTSQVVAAESKLQAQEAISTASKANYDRLLETSKIPGTISQNDLDQAIAKRNSDLAQLEAAKAAYKEISVIKSYLEIRAPFSGIISARNVNPGAYVGPAGKGSEFPLFTLQQQKQLRLAVSVPEALTSYLKPGGDVSFKVKAMPGETYKATVKRMAGALDLRLRSERIEMDVFNEDKKLLPGMVAEVTLQLPSGDSTFIVPKTAVVNSNEGVFIIKVVNNKTEKLIVKKGREINDKVEIFGDILKGETFIVKANEEIRNGSLVKK